MDEQAGLYGNGDARQVDLHHGDTMRRRISQIIDFLPDPTFAIDDMGRVIFWNKAMEELTGVAAADMLGKADHAHAVPFYGERRPILIDLVLQPDDEVEQTYASFTRAGESIYAENRVEGVDRFLWGKASPIRDEHGRLIGAIESLRDISERKRMERACQDAISALVQLADFLPDPTFAVDSQGRVILWNKAIERLSGLSAQAMLGRDDCAYSLPFHSERRRLLVEYILHPELTLPEEPSLLRYDDGSIGYEGDFYFNGTGRTRSVIAHAGSIHDSLGAVVGAIETVRDVTEHKQMGLALQASEEKFRLLFESSSDGNLIMEDGRYIDCNAAAVRIAGLEDKSQLIGTRPVDASPEIQPDGAFSAEKVREMLDLALEKGCHQFEWMRRRADGSELLIDVRLTAIPMQGKKLLHLVWRDITDHKRAEAALSESEERYRSLFENAIEGVYRSTPAGRVVSVNPSLARIAGYESPREFIASVKDIAWDLYADPEDRCVIGRMLADHNRVEGYEAAFRHRDGGRIWASLNVNTVRDGQGNIQYYEGTCVDITERKRVEQALKESEEKFRLLFESSTDGNLLMEDGRFIDCNAAALRMIGMADKSQLIGARPMDTSPERQPDGISSEEKSRRMIELAMEKGYHFFEWFHQRADGSELLIEARLTAIPMQGKQLMHIVWRDITERKRAEEELRASEERYRSLFENAAEGIFRSTPAGRFLVANPAFARMGGFASPRELIDSIQDVAAEHYVNPEDRRTLLRLLEEHDKIEGFEVEIFRKDKSHYWISLNMHTVRDAAGNILYYDGMDIDITDRKRAEKLLRESEEQFRTLVENATEGVFRSTPAGRFLTVNPSLARMGGFSSPREMIHAVSDIGRELYANPEDRRAMVRMLTAGEQVEGYETEFMRRDGCRIWVSMNIHAIRDGQGDILYFDGTCVDITERKGMEQALRESEEKFRLLFESSADGNLLVEDGRIIDCNEAALGIAGCPDRSLLVGARPEDFSPDLQPDGVSSRDKAWCMMEATLRQGFHRFEWLHRRFDGALAHVDIMLTAVPMHGKKLLFTTWRDISDRKRAEEDLRASEERYRILFENATEGIFRSTPAGTFMIINPSLARMVGYPSPTEALASVQDVGRQHYANLEDRLTIMGLLEEHGKVEGFEVEILRRDKSRMWLSMNMHAVRSEEGNILYIDGTCVDITERKRAETELRASEERYRTLFDNATEGIFRSTPAGKFMSVNPSFARMIGFSSPREVVDTIGDIAAELYAVSEERRTLLRLLGEHDKVEGFEIEFLRRDKSGFWMSVNIHTVRDEEGNILYLDGTCVDTTERKLAEERLRESEHRLSQFVDFLPEATLAIDLDGRVLVWNKAMEDMTGVKAVEILGKSRYTHAIPFYGKQAPLLVDLCLKPDAEAEKQYTFIRKEDNLLIAEAEVIRKGMHVWGKASRIFDSRGELIGAIETIRDITDRKKAENRLRKSEEQYRLVAENIHDIIALYDLDFTYTYVSPSVERIAGYPPHEMVGRPALELITGESKARMEAILTQVHDLVRTQDPFLPSRSWTVELARTVKTGQTMWTESNISFLLDECGTPLGLLSVTRDINERKRAQEQMDFYQDHLQRTQKLEAIGTLAGGIAHDFNNILSVIIGYSELIRDELPTDNRSRRKVVEVLKASERAKDLVKQILTFSRQVESRATPLNIHLIVKEALKLLRATIPATITIEQDIDPHAGTVLVDPIQIHQVVMNLCTNAYHALQEESGVLTVALQTVTLDEDSPFKPPELQAGTYIRLTVRDTGCGMDESTMRRVFEPFFTTKDPGRGTGLGLSITHGIVKRLGGAITLSSIPGAGSTFEVFLPRFGIDAAPDMGEAEVVPLGAGERILLVDDEPDIVAFGQIMLEQIGYTVQGCSASREALEIFRADPQAFDLVITDETMPDLRGDQLAQAMLAIRPALPIVLMTGYSTVVDPEGALRLGIREFIPKPFSRSAMAHTILSALQNN